MRNDLVAQVHVTLAPNIRVTVEALKGFGEILQREETSPVVLEAWIVCVEQVAKAIIPVPVEAERARLN